MIRAASASNLKCDHIEKSVELKLSLNFAGASKFNSMGNFSFKKFCLEMTRYRTDSVSEYKPDFSLDTGYFQLQCILYHTINRRFYEFLLNEEITEY